MKNIRFVAFKGKSFVSKAIRFVTRSKNYSHIAYLDLDSTLIECWPTKTNPFQHWTKSSFENHKPGTKFEVWEFELSGLNQQLINRSFLELVSSKTKYNWLGCLAFVFKFLAAERSDRLFCSEGCIRPIVKFLHWDRVVPSHVSPQNFIELIQAMGGVCVEQGET